MTFVSALLPILMLIFLGFGLRRVAFLSDDVWVGIGRLNYFVMFPALLISALSTRQLSGSPWLEIAFVVVLTLIVLALALIFWQRFQSELSGAEFTSVFQGGIRFNTYIALAVAQAVFGVEGLALASVASGMMIVLINLMCVSVFMWVGDSRISGPRAFVAEISANPLIIACAIGWFLSLSELTLPKFAADSLQILGQAALPLGLVIVGAALRLDALKGHVQAIVLSSSVQLLIKPLIVAVLCLWLGLDGIAAGTLLIVFMVPTAPSSYVLAKQLGGDAESMASIITFQTLFAFVSMPLIAAWLLF